MRHIVLALILATAGCAKPGRTVPEGPNKADAQFKQLAREYLKDYLAWRPQTGTQLGLHEFDGKVTDYSHGSIQSEFNRLTNFLATLESVPTNRLSFDSLLDFRILHGAVRREIFGFEHMQVYWRNPMTYAGALDVDIYIKRDFAPLPDRCRSIIAILKQAPSLMAAARANLERSLPRPQVETAIQQADGAADFLSKDLVEALRELTEAPLLAEFTAANSKAVDEVRSFSLWLKSEKLPEADNRYALGREKYIALLASAEMVGLAPEELLALGTRELRRTQESFAETAHAVDATKPAIEVFKEIQREHPTAENLIKDTARNLESIRQFLVDRKIVTLPSAVRVQVREMPKYLRATGFASMDTPGPFETRATQAYYYVTPTEPEWTAAQKEQWLTAFNYYTTDIVSIHEAYPGHYVQFLCLNASKANDLRKVFASYAFTEGWAHYAEQMMIEEGFGVDPQASKSAATVRAAKFRLAQLDEALLRLCRFCVSIRMHCQGMTVEEATQFFKENCYYEEKPARQEALRGAYDPEYLYYTLGKLQLLKLRKDWRSQEGTSFSLQRFHDELLRHGAPPVRLLRHLMIKDQALWDQIL